MLIAGLLALLRTVLGRLVWAEDELFSELLDRWILDGAWSTITLQLGGCVFGLWVSFCLDFANPPHNCVASSGFSWFLQLAKGKHVKWELGTVEDVNVGGPLVSPSGDYLFLYLTQTFQSDIVSSVQLI